MTDEEFKRLVRMSEQLSDKLDTQASESRERSDKSEKEFRERWDGHERDHRSHDKEHSIIGQWQVKKEQQLRDGAATMAELKKRTQPISSIALAGIVVLIIGAPAAGVNWVNEKLDSKADKTIYATIETKANSADVKSMNDKIDALTISVTHLVDKILKEKKDDRRIYRGE